MKLVPMAERRRRLKNFASKKTATEIVEEVAIVA
jgi:hypothetical protein